MTEDREPYRDDVREALEAAGWRETAEGWVVAPNGALWTETNSALDSGVDAPDKAWSVAFDNTVPADVIAAVALVASDQLQPNLEVSLDGIAYLVGRHYGDRDGALWQITGDRDTHGRPLVFLLPEGAGEDVPLDEVVADFGPLALHPRNCPCKVHTDNDTWRSRNSRAQNAS